MKPRRMIFGLALVSAACRLMSAQPQQYLISTFAGGAPTTTANTSYSISSVATDTSGNVYFATGFNGSCVCVFKLDPNGVMTRVAGSGQPGFSGDGGPATSAQLSVPVGMAVDGAGNLFIADEGQFAGPFPWGPSTDRIRKVSPDGIITTVAGGGSLAGSAADGGPATSAELFFAVSVAVDSAGNLFVSETLDDWDGGNNRIRKISPDGIITTVVGNGTEGFAGDGGPAINAALNGPGSLAIDGNGNLFFVDLGNQSIRQVSPDGIITTVLAVPANSLAVDPAGNIFFGFSDGSIFEQSPDGTITTLADSSSGLGGSLAVDAADNLYVGGFKVAPDGTVTPLVVPCCYSGDGGPATSAQLQLVNNQVADGADNLFVGSVDAGGNLYFADSGNHRIRKVDPAGIITTVVGNGVWNARCNSMTSDSGPAASAQLCAPSAVAVDGVGNLFIVDRNRIREVSTDGTIASLAGDGTVGSGIGGDGMPATQPLTYPNSVAVDLAGNVFFTEWSRVRKITPDGTVTTVAGTGTPRFTNDIGDGQPAVSVQLYFPASVTLDGTGNLYFVDTGRIRRVTPDGIINSVAGGGTLAGTSADGGPATSTFLFPHGVTVDSAGNLYISEPVRVRQVTSDGIIHTIAGTGDPGYSGDGGPATQAQLHSPTGLTVDGAGNIYFADVDNNVVRVLRPIQ